MDKVMPVVKGIKTLKGFLILAVVYLSMASIHSSLQGADVKWCCDDIVSG